MTWNLLVNTNDYVKYSMWTPKYNPDNIGYDYSGGDETNWNALQHLYDAKESDFDDAFRVLVMVAEQAGQVAVALAKVKTAPSWDGQAADAYKNAVGTLPDYYEIVHDAYGQSAAALASYGKDVMAAQKYLKQQLAEYDRYTNEGSGPYVAALNATYSDEQTGLRAIHKVQEEIETIASGIYHSTYRLTGPYQTYDRILQNAINMAPQPPPDTRPGWEKALDSVGDFFKDAAVGLGKTIWNTPKAVSDFFSDPSWKTFGEFAETVTVDAGALVLAASMPEGFVGLVGLDVGETGASAATLRSLGYIVKGSKIIGLISTTAGATGNYVQGNYAAGTTGLLSLAVPEAGDIFGVGDDALSTIEHDSAALSKFKTALSEHDNDAQKALSSMSKADQERVESLVTNPSSESQLVAAERQVATDLRAARTNAGLIGAPLTIYTNKALIEPALANLGEQVDGKVEGTHG